MRVCVCSASEAAESALLFDTTTPRDAAQTLLFHFLCSPFSSQAAEGEVTFSNTSTGGEKSGEQDDEDITAGDII